MSERSELIGGTVSCSPRSGEMLTGAPAARQTEPGPMTEVCTSE
jgi:hypothetical protein